VTQWGIRNRTPEEMRKFAIDLKAVLEKGGSPDQNRVELKAKLGYACELMANARTHFEDMVLEAPAG